MTYSGLKIKISKFVNCWSCLF